MYAIEVKDISVYYDNVLALDNVSFNIKEKEFLGLIGPNGAGKSTLLKVLLGLKAPSKGTVKIYGKPTNKAKNFLGYVPQSTHFDRSFPIDVKDVVLMGRLKPAITPFHRYKQKDKEMADFYMKKLGVYSLRNRQIGQLSGGQLQKVLIARALTVEPKILLLDEPTASVDAQATTEIYELLKELNKSMTIVLVSHNIGAVSSYVDSIACVNKKLYYHEDGKLSQHSIENVFGCPIDLIAHGVPHRVLGEHSDEEE